MTKTRLTVLAAAVWMTALGASAALALIVNRPFAAPAPSRATTAPMTLARVEPISPAPAPPQHYVLPTVEITAAVSRPVTAKPAAPPRPRDISEMKCTHMRALEQGSGGVQICE